MLEADMQGVLGAYLFIEIGRPRQVADSSIDAPPKILKNHVAGVVVCRILKSQLQCLSLEATELWDEH